MKFKDYITEAKEAKFKVGDIVKIKPEFRDSKEEKYNFNYKILEINNKILIQVQDSKLSIPSTELVKPNMITKD